MVNNSHLYEYEAMKLAENEADWMLYFKRFAKHFVESFRENYGTLEQWVAIVRKNDPRYENIAAIKNRLVTYYRMYMALNPRPNGELDLNKDLLYKFHKITDSHEIEKIKKATIVLNLKKYEFLGKDFSLDELLNLALSFFLDREVRYQFFKNAICLSPEKVNNETLVDLVVQDKNRNFQSLRA